MFEHCRYLYTNNFDILFKVMISKFNFTDANIEMVYYLETYKFLVWIFYKNIVGVEKPIILICR